MSANKRPLVQSLKNFIQNTNEKNIFSNALSMPDVVEANINDYIPGRTLKVLKDFMIVVDKVLPGFADDGNTVYSPSFEMGWKKVVIFKELETNIKGIYIIGDVTGHFSGVCIRCFICKKNFRERYEYIMKKILFTVSNEQRINFSICTIHAILKKSR